MPRYGYFCPSCDNEYVLFRPMDLRVLTRCHQCNALGEYRPLLTAAHAPYVQSPYVDNNLFGNGSGSFDEALGVEVRSRRQKEELLADRGLTMASDYGGFTGPQSLTVSPKPTPNVAVMEDAIDKAANMVKYNELPPEEPVPAESIHLMTEGYKTV